MVEAIRFQNFRVLRDTRLPLAGVTIIVGPNGSGKTTALDGLRALRQPQSFAYPNLVSVGAPADAEVELSAIWAQANKAPTTITWKSGALRPNTPPGLDPCLTDIRVFALDPGKIAAPVQLEKKELAEDGSGLARVLTMLRDECEERWNALNRELQRLIPEFDRILLDKPDSGQRSFLLRTANGRHSIAAHRLSQGTLLALTLLTLAHLPKPPPIIGLEEPDRGIHPRLLRKVQDALYRLSRPADSGDDRPPVQVVVTTHSPYFLDMFRDHPEEVVIAQKKDLEAEFIRLADWSNVDEILRDSHLGEAWYSGVLGGVPLPS